MLNYSKVHNRFKFNGFHYSRENLKHLGTSLIKEGSDFDTQIGAFILDWIDNKSYVVVNSSGSTGTPKSIRILKSHMLNSAIATGDFFKLCPGDKALMCLPANYIAGKMMIVRAIILGLELDVFSPSLDDLNCNEYYSFAAVVPLQLEKLTNFPHNIKTIIVGGAPVSNRIKQKLFNSKCEIFETYGMTETVSHVAVRNLNTKLNLHNNPFKVLPNVKISKDENNCLVIEASHLTTKKIVTNDIVKLISKTSFNLLGRIDNIINSGGIKLNPEFIEQKLSQVIENRYFISSEPNKKLGSQVILIIESKNKTETIDFSVLDKYEIPKTIYYLEAFAETNNGKLDRSATYKLLKVR